MAAPEQGGRAEVPVLLPKFSPSVVRAAGSPAAPPLPAGIALGVPSLGVKKEGRPSSRFRKLNIKKILVFQNASLLGETHTNPKISMTIFYMGNYCSELFWTGFSSGSVLITELELNVK